MPKNVDFTTGLLHWNRMENDRQMPWKGEKDPYKIWLSEIILQQTRVEQGLNYYQNFITAFPTIQALATAPEEKIFKLWEGLGYYSRCRNIITTAKYIAEELGGVFPTGYQELLALKGVGTYTAAAIASFAYNLPFAVLDGNVFRVLSRILSIDTPIDSTAGKKEFAQLAQQLLPPKNAGEYNQAIMDFGAVICKPEARCKVCFFSKQCKAYATGKQDVLPVKGQTTKVRKRWLNYFIVQCGNQFLIQQRTGKDVWKDLFQFCLIETPKADGQKKLVQLMQQQLRLPPDAIKKTWNGQQKLSHQTIYFTFFLLKVKTKIAVINYKWVKLTDLQHFTFPKMLKQVIQEYLQ